MNKLLLFLILILGFDLNAQEKTLIVSSPKISFTFDDGDTRIEREKNKFK